jgi:spore coat polysaccharide biosynthesis protein SpsF
MTTIAVIQARASSTRFPGKVLADLNGRPMLAHVVERVRRCRTIDRVVVATSTGPTDDAVAELAQRSEASVVRGPLDDVLGRFVMAAREYSASVVVRITADCPLVDPELIDTLVEMLAREGADYASNVDPRTYPDGYDVEVMTRECLERLDREASRPDEREHVTVRVREHPGEYRRASLRLPRDLSEVRLTVDYPEDLVKIGDLLTALLPRTEPGLGAVLRAMGLTVGLPVQGPGTTAAQLGAHPGQQDAEREAVER